MSAVGAPKITEWEPDLLSKVSIEHGCGDYIIKWAPEEDDYPEHCPGCGEKVEHARK